MNLTAPDPHQPTTAEPQRISEVLTTPNERDAFIARWETELTRDPSNTHRLGVCHRCETPLGETADDKIIPLGVLGFFPNICCPACSAAGKQALIDADQLARESAFDGVIPLAFRKWDEAKGTPGLRDRVLKQFSFTERRGMVIHGPTRSGKTHLAWWLMRHILEAGAKMPHPYTCLVCDSYELATKGIPPEAQRMDFLVIDDLGNEPKSTKFESGLLHLLSKRLDWKRPTIITTQLCGVSFKQQFFSGATGSAILGRFREGSVMIGVNDRNSDKAIGAAA
jgi:DNA replication protein DnaC